MNNPEQFEKEAFVDRINEISFAINEFEELYEKVPITDHFVSCQGHKRNRALEEDFIRNPDRI